MTTKFLVRKRVSPKYIRNNQDKHQNFINQCNAERYTMATISNGSTKLNIWVEIKR